jgi:multiple sugar transport system substrate-binding protein
MSRKSTALKFLVLSLLLVAALSGVSAQDRVQITWFVGLGTGTNDEQIAAQNQVVEEFNASQDEIELVINIGASFETSRDTLSTLIAAGTPPDIIGPVGVGGSNAFAGQWLDLAPLVESSGFDLSIFDPALVELYRTPEGALEGIPFAVYPSVTYFNRDLFDEADLEYPPQEFGAPYILDGEEVPWNYDTIAEIAKILTVDGEGNDATMEEFNPEDIVQFGMNFQWAQPRLYWTAYQPEELYNAETGEITFPESWREATQWIYDRTWVDYTMPNTTYGSSELFGAGNVFSSGNLAMAITPLWYTCCLDSSVGSFEWDLAVVPQSPDGEYHVATDADTFRIHRDTQNPEEAFTVLTYLLTEAVPSLTAVYGAFPAHPDYQAADIERKQERYPWDINWQVAVDSLAYNNPGPLHHEANFPNWQKGFDRMGAFNTLLFGDTGVDIDLQAELDTLQSDLQSIVDEVAEGS